MKKRKIFDRVRFAFRYIRFFGDIGMWSENFMCFRVCLGCFFFCLVRI